MDFNFIPRQNPLRRSGTNHNILRPVNNNRIPRRRLDFHEEDDIREFDRQNQENIRPRSQPRDIENSLNGNGVNPMYCMKCKRKTSSKGAYRAMSKNNRPMIKATCSECGCKKCLWQKMRK